MIKIIVFVSLLAGVLIPQEGLAQKLIVNMEPVCTIELGSKWKDSEPEQWAVDYCSYQTYYSSQPDHNKACTKLVQVARKDEDLSFLIGTVFISDTSISNLAQLSLNFNYDEEEFRLLGTSEYNGFAIANYSRTTEFCSWDGTTTRDSTLRIYATSRISRDFRMYIEVEVSDAKPGEGEYALNLVQEIIRNIHLKDYGYWDRMRQYPFTRKMLDSLYSVKRASVMTENSKMYRGILNCSGRKALLENYTVEKADSLERLQDEELLNYIITASTEATLNSYTRYFELIYDLNYSYASYYDLARRIHDKKLSASEIFGAMLEPDPQNEFCKYLAYDDCYLYKKKNNFNSPKPEGKNIWKAQSLLSNKNSFPSFLSEFEDDLSELLFPDNSKKITSYSNLSYLNRYNPTDEPSSLYFWAAHSGVEKYTIFEARKSENHWTLDSIAIPFTISDTLEYTERGYKFNLISNDYIACRSDRNDSVFFFSTQDPKHTWYSFIMTPPQDDRFILVWRANPNLLTYHEGYELKKIKHFDHLADKWGVKEGFRQWLLNNDQLIHSTDTSLTRRWSQSEAYYQINDTAFVFWKDYYNAFDYYLHPSLQLYVSEIYTGDLDGLAGDEIFCFTASNGQIIQLTCYTYRDDQMIQLDGNSLIPAALLSNDVNAFLRETLSGNYEMINWRPEIESTRSWSLLMTVIFGSMSMAALFLFARKQRKFAV